MSMEDRMQTPENLLLRVERDPWLLMWITGINLIWLTQDRSISKLQLRINDGCRLILPWWHVLHLQSVWAPNVSNQTEMERMCLPVLMPLSKGSCKGTQMSMLCMFKVTDPDQKRGTSIKRSLKSIWILLRWSEGRMSGYRITSNPSKYISNNLFSVQSTCVSEHEHPYRPIVHAPLSDLLSASLDFPSCLINGWSRGVLLRLLSAILPIIISCHLLPSGTWRRIAEPPEDECLIFSLSYTFQMQHPIQMKPADCEKRNGQSYLKFSLPFLPAYKPLQWELCFCLKPDLLCDNPPLSLNLS